MFDFSPRFMRAFCSLALGGVICLLPSCGALAGAVTLPSRSEVLEARSADTWEWELLEEAYLAFQSGGSSALEPFLASYSYSVRLAVFEQDVRVLEHGQSAALAHAQERLSQNRTPLSMFLAARLEPNQKVALGLLDSALSESPDLVQAKVLRLTLLASESGYYAILDPLRRLLAAYPSCAEGWRILAHYAAIYARPDLVARAASHEPWCRLDSEKWGALYLAEAEIKEAKPQQATNRLTPFGEDDLEVSLMRACSLAESGSVSQAADILRRLLLEHPDDLQVLFNLGLLEMQYLKRRDLAIQHFQHYLDLSRHGATSPMLRRLQVEKWLMELTSSS